MLGRVAADMVLGVSRSTKVCFLFVDCATFTSWRPDRQASCTDLADRSRLGRGIRHERSRLLKFSKVAECDVPFSRVPLSNLRSRRTASSTSHNP